MMHDLWPTKVLIGNIDNKELVDETSQYILQNYDLNNLNVNDLSDNNILKDKNFQNFKKEIIELYFDEWLNQVFDISLTSFEIKSIKAWIAGFQKEYNMVNHNHSNASLSAVFYLLAEGNKNGDVFFFDPRINANRGYKSDPWNGLFKPFIFKPQSYSFVIFPSFLYHQVTPFNGNIRLAIPVDLYL